MNPKLTQLSVVVAGELHNPTILNPDFLDRQGIVPNHWGWKLESATSTPPLGFVKYANGVSLVVDPAKLVVGDAQPSDPVESKVPSVAQGYVATLPHVRYKAVGINFISFVEVKDPAGCLRTRFLREGPWDPVDGVSIKLEYGLDPEGVFNLSLDAVIAEAGDDENSPHREGILAKANFHRPCSGDDPATQVRSFLDLYAHSWNRYEESLARVFKTMD